MNEQNIFLYLSRSQIKMVPIAWMLNGAPFSMQSFVVFLFTRHFIRSQSTRTKKGTWRKPVWSKSNRPKITYNQQKSIWFGNNDDLRPCPVSLISVCLFAYILYSVIFVRLVIQSVWSFSSHSTQSYQYEAIFYSDATGFVFNSKLFSFGKYLCFTQ